MIDPNTLDIQQAVGALEGAWFFGWAIGFILWVVRYLIIELPRTGNIFRKGGENI